MKYYLLALGIALSTLFIGCEKEVQEVEEGATEIDAFNFGPNPGD